VVGGALPRVGFTGLRGISFIFSRRAAGRPLLSLGKVFLLKRCMKAAGRSCIVNEAPSPGSWLRGGVSATYPCSQKKTCRTSVNY